MRRSEAGQDYYVLLGVRKDAPTEAIVQMYRIKARQLHPDFGGDCEAMKLLNEAYEVLKDSAGRKAYDSSREAQREDYGSPFGSSAPTPSARKGGVHTFDRPFLGLLILACVSFALGFFLMSEIGDRRLWMLRVLSVGLLGFGVFMAHSALMLRRVHARNPVHGPNSSLRRFFLTYQGVVLAIGFAALILFVTLQYVR